MHGKINEIRPVIRKGRLKVVAKIFVPEWGYKDAFLPDREVSTILPRCILAGKATRLPRKFLKTLVPIIRRMTIGREVRIWNYEEIYYFSFLSWKNVKFNEGGEGSEKPDERETVPV
ncbi:MAG: hypothetical protein JW969_13755 [Spirochaetales bacterium]|nr:hypothetical protein [Spirochaetales bacterium]